MSRSGVYQILCKSTGHRYIGSAENIDDRWAEHLRVLKRGKHPNKALQDAWTTAGENDFDWTVLELAPEDQLVEKEEHYLETLKPELNLMRKVGGRRVTKERTSVTTLRLGEALMDKLKKHSYASRRSQTDIVNEALEEWLTRNGFTEVFELHVTPQYVTLIKLDIDQPPQVLEVQERNGLSPKQMAEKLALKYKTPIRLVEEKYQEKVHEQPT
jgi:group I intron endonuclease